jgi:hypothetical protein
MSSLAHQELGPQTPHEEIKEVISQYEEGLITVTEMYAKVATLAAEAWGQVPSRLDLHADEAQDMDTPDTVAYLKDKNIVVTEQGVRVIIVGTRAALEDMLLDLKFFDPNDDPAEIEASLAYFHGQITEEGSYAPDCAPCKGTGKVHDPLMTCSYCKGTGKAVA